MERVEAVWPELLTSRRAVAYSGRSRTSINRAVLAGLLPVAGRVGAVGERVFRRSDIDAWLLGRSAPRPDLRPGAVARAPQGSR
jgi:predicted DNA-binding transcriptional regulator AlpA